MDATIKALNSDRELKLNYPKCQWSDYINKTFISREMFQEILAVYENNQEYYNRHQMFKEMSDFEYWFLHVVEPPSTDIKTWLSREESKLVGHSPYSMSFIKASVNMGGRDFSFISQNLLNCRTYANQFSVLP